MDEPDFLADARRYRNKAGPTCSVCLFLWALAVSQPELAAQVREAMADRSISTTGIVAALRDRALTLDLEEPEQAINRHRRKHAGRMAA